MFTRDEVMIISEDRVRDAINKKLNELLVFNGGLDVTRVELSNIEYAIHLLRHYKALSSTAPVNEEAVA